MKYKIVYCDWLAREHATPRYWISWENGLRRDGLTKCRARLDAKKLNDDEALMYGTMPTERLFYTVQEDV